MIERYIGLVRRVFKLYPDEELVRQVEIGARHFNAVHRRSNPNFVPIEVSTREAVISEFDQSGRRPLRDHLDRLASQPDHAQDLIPVVDAWLDSRDLNERERAVIKMRFGLGLNEEPMSLKAIGMRIGVARESISQNLAKAMRKLRLEDNVKPMIDFLQG